MESLIRRQRGIRNWKIWKNIAQVSVFIVLLFGSDMSMAQVENRLSPADLTRDLRNSMDVYWAPFEAGTFYLSRGEPDEDSKVPLYEGLEKYAPHLDPNNEKFDQDFSCFVFPHYERVFREGQLDPGVYSVPIDHLWDKETGLLDTFLEDMEYLRIPKADFVDFDITRDHILLLRAMNFECFGGSLMTHVKRPYGESNYFYPDMAHILGESVADHYGDDGYLSEDRASRYRRLHEEMLLVIQAFWKLAKL